MQFIDFPKIDIRVEGMDGVKIPKMARVKQLYDDSAVSDIPDHLRRQLEETIRAPERFRGKRICVTVGSRGIPFLDAIVKTVLDVLAEWGASPFILPAMGSHGGATAKGQIELIAGYGVTEAAMGYPVVKSMDVVRIGSLADGTPVYCDKIAMESDGIVVLNKVKPHTDFRAKHESGLAKMMSIGLANHIGASAFHQMGFHTFAERIPEVCEVFLQNAPIAFGVGIVQNAYDRISRIDVAEKERFLEKDAELLEIAKASVPRFKVRDIDVLIVDRIGKNISGNGTDPNVVGRSNSKGFEDVLNLKKLFIRGLTEETHHSACGINLADITTRRVLRDVDFEATWVNCVTATMLTGGSTPMYAETDREALALAIRTCNGIDFERPRVVRILDTLHMAEIEVSEALLEEFRAHPEAEVLSDLHDMQFDEDGFLTDIFEQ